MQIPVSSYIARSSAVHNVDARVKIVLLFVFTLGLFLVNTWGGLFVYVAALILAIAATKIGIQPFHSVIIPVEILAFVTLLFNAFSLDPAGYAAMTTHGWGGLDVSFLAQFPAIYLIGPMSLVPEGVERGAFLALRIIILVQASLVLTYTTTSTQLMSAFSFFLAPLGRLHFPVDDMVTVFSLALRFIPVTAEEFGRVHDAQLVRGASFDKGRLWARLQAWQSVLIPLFVGLFRRAEVLANAMEARCYRGKSIRRTELLESKLRLQDVLILIIGLLVFFAVGLLW